MIGQPDDIIRQCSARTVTVKAFDRREVFAVVDNEIRVRGNFTVRKQAAWRCDACGKSPDATCEHARAVVAHLYAHNQIPVGGRTA